MSRTWGVDRKCDVCGISSKETPLFNKDGKWLCGVGKCGGWVRVGKLAGAKGVNPKTVSRWADAGKIAVMRTPGGHRRVREW